MILWFDYGEKKNCGMVLDSDAENYSVKKVSDSALRVFWKDKYVQFEEHRIVCKTNKIHFYTGNKTLRVGEELVDHNNNGNIFYVNPKPDIKVSGNSIEYEYKGNKYYLNVENAEVRVADDTVIEITPLSDSEEFYLYPETYKY